ncbi:hypothetical protein CEP54_011061 [Fusarium duplospermum]|uniref:Heterokaryon incompatibility domain-containing protein n=1 Tax=Fusarium duplospermum TaxID=1325734 RepID=A0A428PGH4_9HYPO|nr:hypothetical protein CEP54_011061 [Fusarium duplospermum]
MMRQIYHQARRVLIWLGPQDGQDTLGPLLEIAQKLKAIEPSTLPKDHAARQRYLGFTDTHVLSLAALLSRTWFRRVWIVQEAALARDAILYCGPQSLAWQELCRLLDLESGVNIIGPNYQVGIDLVQAIRSHRTAIGNNASKTLLDVLLHHRPSLATDPKDKVHGFLGLCIDDIIQADYRLASREVYKLLTTRYLLKDCNLEVITASSSPISAHPNSLPSWVPDWSATDVASPLALRTKLLSEMSYYAAGESKWTPKFSDDGDMLGVEVQFIDEIVELGPVRQPYRPTTPDARSLFKQLRTECNVSNSWQKICLGDASGWDSEYLTGETLFDVSWQILLAGCHPSEYETCREQSKRVWSMFRKYLLAHRLRLMPLWAFGLMDNIAKLTG